MKAREVSWLPELMRRNLVSVPGGGGGGDGGELWRDGVRWDEMEMLQYGG